MSVRRTLMERVALFALRMHPDESVQPALHSLRNFDLRLRRVLQPLQQPRIAPQEVRRGLQGMGLYVNPAQVCRS
jgi:hypothetical protein